MRPLSLLKNLEKFLFYSDSEKEVIEGFTPRLGACAYLTKGWGCFVSDTWVGLTKTISQAYESQRSNIHLANYLFCEDCKQIPRQLSSYPSWVPPGGSGQFLK